MPIDIATLSASITAAAGLAKALVEERDRLKAASIQLDFTEKLLTLQAQLGEVIAASVDKDASIQALRQRNSELEAADREKKRYSLAALGIRGDHFAYALRPATELTERVDEPPHFLCQVCFDLGKKVVLKGSQGGHFLACANDKTHAIQLSALPPAPPPQRRTYSPGI